MKVYKKIMNGLAFVEKLVLVLSTILIVVLTVGNVLSRKVLHQSWSFTEELVVAVFVLITLLAAALAARDGELVNLSLLPDRLSAKARRILLVVNTAFSVAFTVVLFKYGMDKVLTQLANGKRTFVLNWPEWIFWSFVPIGAACMTLHMIEYLIDTFVKAKEEGQKNDQCNSFSFILCFLILGIPIGICLGLSSICAILYSGTSLTIVATNMYSGISKFLLLAIPFFVLSGNIMAKAGISKRLIRFVDTCVGHKKGGIAIVCVIVACFFGAISGSGPATVAALGMVLIPAMIERGGFSAPFSTALMATASSIAIVIPPSIAFVVYASITGVSIADMFTAGIFPGILMGVALVIVVLLEAKKHNIQPTQKKATAKERWDAFKDAFWGFLMPVIILGGIYGSVFTPTEAAAVSVVYGLFVGIFIYKEIKLKDLWDLMVDSAKTTGGIMLIVASASLFSFVCTKFGIAQAASDLLGSVAHNQFVFLLIVNIIFLIAGCFIDANSAMYIFIPIMLPVCKALGYDLVAFGIVATVNLAIGQVTPPVGVNLFVAISVKLKKGMEVTIQQISKAVMPMIAASVTVLLLITYVPQISTFLPKALAKDGAYTGTVAAATNSDTSSGDGADGSTAGNSSGNEDYNDIADYSDLGWEEQTWNFTCSTTETSTWAEGGRKFGELMEKATGGKIKVNVYAADQLTNGNQSEGIQALMNGDPVQISMHSNLIYSAFDPRFNVVSLPFLFDSVEDADAKLDGKAGEN